MRFWSQSEDEYLRSNYTVLLAKDIAANVGRSESSVQNRANALGLKKGYKKYHHNEDFFLQDTIETCYWAGLLAADGWIKCVGKVNNLFLALKESDGYLVQAFARALEYDGVVKTREFEGYKTSVLEVCACPGLIGSLRRFGIVPRKSLVLEPPKIENFDHTLAFIKGYIDGDGCIRLEKGRMELSMVGTQMVLEWIQGVFDKLVPPLGKLRAKARKRKGKRRCSDYKITGHRAKLIVDRLHSIATPCLSRKWLVVESYEPLLSDKQCYQTRRNKFQISA